MKRISISLLLCIALVSSSVISTGAVSFAADDQDLSSTKGVYWFDTHELGDDRTDTYIYDDELLKGDSLDYNQKLATMSFELAVASISSEREPKTEAGYANKSRNLRAYLEDNGFTDFDTNDWYKKKMTTETMGAACAHKKIIDGGKEYTLIAIVPRSAGYEAEWGGNFVMSDEAGDSGDSAGFRNGKKKVLDFAREYINKYGIKGDIKVWTAGYSRGAGVTNQVGAALANRPQDYLGSSVNLESRNLYCYTFGTPNSASTRYTEADVTAHKSEGSYDNAKFEYVHNTFEPYDIITIAPPKDFGFDRYGSNKGYAVSANKDRMLKFLKNTNSEVYRLYMNGGDPDGFKRKTLQYSLIDGAHNISIVDYTGESDYLPTTQAGFMAMMSESITQAMAMDTAAGGEGATARQKYYAGKYQAAMHDLCGYYFANLDKGGAIAEGIEGSKYVKPMVASLYISYMLEMYKNEISAKSNEQLAVLQEALNALVTAAGGTGGNLPDDAPQEIKEAYNALKTEISKTEEAETKWTNIATLSRALSTALFREVFRAGLDKAGVESNASIRRIVTDTADDKGNSEARALSRILSYLMLYDTHQPTNRVISFETTADQVMHMATFMGNASSYMRPHNNEIILSWLRTLDDSYDNMENEKENDAQTAGYRRLYIDQPDGSDVTATVRDGSGSVVATVKNGKLISRTDSWIGVTTSDNGNWLRLPADKTYRIELSSDKTVSVDLKATEFSVYEGKEVRTVTSDRKYKWTGLSLEPGVKTTWVISAIAAPYNIASDAYYYIERTNDSSSVLMAKGICKGKRSVKLSWTAVDGADRYVVYSARCKTKGKKYKIKKIKTLSSAKTKWTKKYLRKNCSYKFYVVAQKKVGAKYVQIAKSRTIYLVTGNRRGRYTNPKKLTLKTDKIELAAGESYVIKGSVKKAVSGRKLLTNHVARLRFSSDNPSVATVDSSGKVTAEAAGSCRIYVQTINGIWKSVQVTVR